MRIFLVSAAILLFFSGCLKTTVTQEEKQPKSTEHALIQITEKQQLQDIPFENGNGRAIVVFDERYVVDCMIFARGLKPEESYFISFMGDNGASPGVLFGPKENVQIRVGSLEGEVNFKSNSEGELFVSMRNPVRMMTKAKEVIFLIQDKDNKEIMRTAPFAVIKKGI